MSRILFARLRQQLGPRCGYCQTSSAITGETNTIDHIIPTALGGTSEEENLCVACRRCNRNKSTHTNAVDPETDKLVPLYNPRTQQWDDHFVWSTDGIQVSGLTPSGCATVVLLQMNHPDIVSARRLWVSVGWHPPEN